MNENFEGIVLFKRLHRENDSLVKIFTNYYGTKMFFVKGLEKPNHPNRTQLLPFTFNSYIGNINESSLSFIKESRTLDMFRNIQIDYERQAYVSYIIQLIDAAINDNQKEEQIYQLLIDILKAIDQGFSAQIATLYVEIHLLQAFGTAVDFTCCRICGSHKQPFDFSIRHQGVLCERHWQEDDFRLKINPKAMYIAGELAKTSFHLIQSVKVSPETMRELRRLMDEIYQEYVGLRLKSKSYLNQLESMAMKVEDITKKAWESD